MAQDFLEKRIRTVRKFTLIALAIVLFCLTGWLWFKQYRCRYWPHTDGVVQSAEIQERDRFDSQYKKDYVPVIKYNYEVSGIQYVGSRIFFGNSLYAYRKDAQPVVEYYSPGKHVTVYYDPQNPRNCVLTTRSDPTTYYSAFLGVFILVIGLIYPVQRKTAY